MGTCSQVLLFLPKYKIQVFNFKYLVNMEYNEYFKAICKEMKHLVCICKCVLSRAFMKHYLELTK